MGLLRSRIRLRRRLAIYGGALLVLVFAAIMLDARCFIESRTFYFPMREAFITPPGAQDVAITTPDGLTLHGWFLPPRNWKSGDALPPAVLHVHGNAGHVGWHLEFSQYLTNHGFAVLIFDYRGYGRSDLPLRALQREDLLTDTLAAFDHLAERDDVDVSRLAIYGVSLGGVLGLAAAAERPKARAVVSIAAFASWRGIVANHASPLARLAIKSGLDGVDSMSALGERQVLIVHGSADTIVPPMHGRLLTEAAARAGVPAQLLTLPAGHNDILIGDLPAQRQVVDFLRSALDLPMPSNPGQ